MSIAPMPIAPKRARIDPELHQAAAALVGAPLDEVINVEAHPHGLIIYTSDGGSYIDVPEDRPDALGQSGLLIYETATWHPVTDGWTMHLPAFVDPAPQAAAAADPWTLAELQAEAEKRAGRVNRNAYPQLLAGGDPRDAMGILLTIARRLRVVPRAAVSRDQVAAQAWDLISRSGWLDESELDKL